MLEERVKTALVGNLEVQLNQLRDSQNSDESVDLARQLSQLAIETNKRYRIFTKKLHSEGLIDFNDMNFLDHNYTGIIGSLIGDTEAFIEGVYGLDRYIPKAIGSIQQIKLMRLPIIFQKLKEIVGSNGIQYKQILGNFIEILETD